MVVFLFTSDAAACNPVMFVTVMLKNFTLFFY